MRAQVALFGGSFDPPHLGHAYAITYVLATQRVDELWMVPTAKHAFGKQLAPFETRIALCELIADIFGARVRVESVESELLKTQTFSRSVDTVEALRERYPEVDFSWVIGSDLVSQIDSWKDSERLLSLVRILVVPRDDHPITHAPIPNISSSLLRQRLLEGGSVRDLVPSAVADELEGLKLYQRVEGSKKPA